MSDHIFHSSFLQMYIIHVLIVYMVVGYSQGGSQLPSGVSASPMLPKNNSLTEIVGDILGPVDVTLYEVADT